MQRRRLLQLGIASALVFAVAGAGVDLLRPGLEGGRPTEGAEAVLRAVAFAVLDGTLPAGERERAQVLHGHMRRVVDAVAGLPPATQAELSQLLGLLASTPGRIVFCGLATDWRTASVHEVQQALQAMRLSSLSLRMQAYHALRDLTNAAYYADPVAWPAIGYPGPPAL